MPALDLTPALNEKAIAVAFSGGGDSTALVHMLATSLPNHKIHALTVDHGLRPESAAEAATLTAWLKPYKNVKHVILKWEGDKPSARIMETARQARYHLMADYCHNHKIHLLAIGHHGDDQRETLLMRLARASGLDGLVGMRPLKPFDETLTLWRPLLGFTHDALITYNRDHHLNWVEDPTNQNPEYMRPRLRMLGDALAAEGMTADHLHLTTARLARAANALDEYANRLYQSAYNPQTNTFDLSLIRAEPDETIIRLLRRIIDETGQGTSNYGTRFDKIESLADTLKTALTRHKTTLGGCVITINPKASTLQIVAENTR